MWTEKDIAWAILFICMIVLAPATHHLARAFFRYVFNKYISSEDIIVTHMENGTAISRYRLSKFPDGRISYTPLSLDPEVNQNE